MTDFMKRIERIKQQITADQYPVVILDTGETFETETDLITHLLKYGATTQDGRIVSYQKPDKEYVDTVSLSLYECIDSMLHGEADVVIIDDL